MNWNEGREGKRMESRPTRIYKLELYAIHIGALDYNYTRQHQQNALYYYTQFLKLKH